MDFLRFSSGRALSAVTHELVGARSSLVDNLCGKRKES